MIVSEDEQAVVESKQFCENCGEELKPDPNYPELVKYCPNCYWEWNPFGM